MPASPRSFILECASCIGQAAIAPCGFSFGWSEDCGPAAEAKETAQQVTIVKINFLIVASPVCDCRQPYPARELLASGRSGESQQTPPAIRHVGRAESCATSDPTRRVSCAILASRI